MKEIEVTILLSKSPDNPTWVATVPSIPGCQAEGNDKAEASLLIKPAIQFFTKSNPALSEILANDQATSYVVERLKIEIPAHSPDHYPD